MATGKLRKGNFTGRALRLTRSALRLSIDLGIEVRKLQVLFGSTSLTIEQVKAGKLRPLAVTTATRWEGLPEVPTMAEFLPGYEATAVFGLGAPKNVPTEIIDKLNTEINAGLADPKIKMRLGDFGATILAGSPADFAKLLADETQKWAKVVKFAGIKVE